ncbi:Ankyrin repeat-containing protein ITN1, partial [Bienertia sinuspersici]
MATSSLEEVEGDEEELCKAAERGDVEFIRKCVASNKPYKYYLTLFTAKGNIFHITADGQEEEFVREVIEGNLLPMELIHQLLCQPCCELHKENPVHVAARRGNIQILKTFLNVFNNNNHDNDDDDDDDGDDDDDKPPWLLTDVDGETPCYTAVTAREEECALEIMKRDKEWLLPNMLNDDGESLLYCAVEEGLNKVAMEILSSSRPFSFSGPCGHHALHVLPGCSSEGRRDVYILLFEKGSNLITQKSDDGESIFHIWARMGKLWPFECVFKSSDDTIPYIGRDFVDLISATNNKGRNPLHYLAKIKKSTLNEEGVKIGKLLIDTYRRHKAIMSSNTTGELQYPWLVQDNRMNTPLDYAIDKGNEAFAKFILLEDENVLTTCQNDVLFKAIDKRGQEIPYKILEIVDKNGWTRLLIDNQRLNVLHLAPKCSIDFENLWNAEELCKQLLKGHPELLQAVDKKGNTILHAWVKIGQVRLFEYIFKNKEIKDEWRKRIIYLLDVHNIGIEDNPLHVAATCTNEATHYVVKLLVEAFLEDFNINPQFFDEMLPWYSKNVEDEGPLHLAIRCQPDQRLALYLLSLYQGDAMFEVLDLYAPKEYKILFLAIQKNFFEVVKFIITKLDKSSWTKYLKDSSTGQNWLVKEAPEFITQLDSSEMSPLDVACNVGATWIVEAMLEKDLSSIFNNAPLAWIKACENEYPSIVHVFVNCYPGKFSDHCIQHHDSPLHHIKLRNLMRYEEFLEIPYMKDLINLQDANGATPLHKAIENRNILLAEALLNVDKIKYNIKDNENRTARDMLARLCKEQKQWDQMCKNIGFDPNLKTSYFQRKADLLEVRNTLSVVAALLATITFTAGFTLPGGFNQDTGEAILANKAAFIVFLISDTIAMCFSMLVLLCLIWSMVFEPNQSLFLIDRSVGLLRIALYCTLLAFMTGVYIVISPKILWVAILVVVMCCLVGITANRTLLYNALSLADNLTSFASKESKDPINLMEM